MRGVSSSLQVRAMVAGGSDLTAGKECALCGEIANPYYTERGTGKIFCEECVRLHNLTRGGAR